MPYAQIEVGALRHPKILTLSDSAFRLWVAGLAYSQEHLTDGAIPEAALLVMGVRSTPKTIAELVDHKLWETKEVGYQIHDYLAWNQSREVVERRRTDARTRSERARERARERMDAQHAHGDAEQSLALARATAYAQRNTGGGPGEGRRGATLVTRRDLSSPLDWVLPVPGKLHQQWVAREATRTNGDTAAAEKVLLDWYSSVAMAWNDKLLPGDDEFDFWRKRYAEWRGVSPSAPKPGERPRATLPKGDAIFAGERL